jgi:anti-anti-sigma factor
MRTREGMAIAKAKGRLKGRAPKLSPTRQAHLLKLHAAGEHTIVELAELFEVSRAYGVPGPGTGPDREQRRVNMLAITTAPVADGVMGVCITGDVDTETAEQVAGAVRAALTAGTREVHVDMAAVTFLDSSGIRTLLQAQHEAAEQRVVLRVVNAHCRVARVLDITGVLHLLQDAASVTAIHHQRASNGAGNARWLLLTQRGPAPPFLYPGPTSGYRPARHAHLPRRTGTPREIHHHLNKRSTPNDSASPE